MLPKKNQRCIVKSLAIRLMSAFSFPHNLGGRAPIGRELHGVGSRVTAKAFKVAVPADQGEPQWIEAALGKATKALVAQRVKYDIVHRVVGSKACLCDCFRHPEAERDGVVRKDSVAGARLPLDDFQRIDARPPVARS